MNEKNMTAAPAGALVACLALLANKVQMHQAGERGAEGHWQREFQSAAAELVRTHGPALLAALRLREWRPIESAPVDGTEFQAWIGDWEPRCRFNEDGVFQIWGRVDYDMDGWDSYPDAPPTHWQPLPAPPTADDLARVLEEGE